MSLLNRTSTILEDILAEHEAGLAPLPLQDLLRIRQSLQAERPVIDHYLTILVNQFEFLSSGFELSEDDNPSTIPRFLSEFRESLQRELLSQERTYKDGLALSLAGD